MYIIDNRHRSLNKSMETLANRSRIVIIAATSLTTLQQPVVDDFQKKDKVVSVKADSSVEEVYSQVKAGIEETLANRSRIVIIAATSLTTLQQSSLHDILGAIEELVSVKADSSVEEVYSQVKAGIEARGLHPR
jgi:hypothetical protein